MAGEDLDEQEIEEDLLKANEFIPVLIDELRQVREQNAFQTDRDAFREWALNLISAEYSACKSDPQRCADVNINQAKAEGIDAAWLAKEEKFTKNALPGVYYVAHIDCPDRITEVLRYSSDAGNSLMKAVEWVDDQDVERTSGMKKEGVRYQYHKYCISGRLGCRAILVLAGLAEDDSLEESMYEISSDNTKMRAEIYDLNRLRGLYVESLENAEDKPPPEVRFKVLSQNQYTKKDAFADALVTEVPLVEIRRLYAQHKLGLFKKNFRGPLADSPFNERMKETVENELERDKFWYYNNGLTAICDGYKFEDGDDETTRTVLADNFQIVNGCQTCSTIYYSKANWEAEDLSIVSKASPSVPLRLINKEALKDNDREFSRKIARYTNSQTAVTDRDQKATDEEQVLAKRDFENYWYFLEVKTDEWRQRKRREPREIKERYVRPWCFTNEDVAQSFLAFWQNRPAFAKTHKSEIWTDEEVFQSVFSTRGPPLIIPAQFRNLTWEWIVKNDYHKRIKDTPAGRKKIFPAEVAKHGELYLVGMLGYSFMQCLNLTKMPRMEDGGLNRALDFCCRNMRRLIIRYRDDDELTDIREEFDSCLDKAHRILRIYSRAECDESGYSSPRNLLVLDSTWKGLIDDRGKDIGRLAAKLLPKIVTDPDKV